MEETFSDATTEQDDKLFQKFLKGLEKLGMTYEDVKHWVYAGGDSEHRIKYFKQKCPDRELPEHASSCVCGHKIKENCYILNIDDNRLLTLGSCCIKKFIPESTKTCNVCGASHKNRIVDRCNDCRPGLCDICNKPCKKPYTKCYSCKFPKEESSDEPNKCTECDKECKKPFTKCYACKFPKKEKSDEPNICTKCYGECKKPFTKCFNCNRKTRVNNCRMCGNKLQPPSEICYSCFSSPKLFSYFK